MVGKVIDVPGEPAAAQERFNGAAGRAFVAGLPRRAARFLGLWGLGIDGPAMHGVSALVLPVVRHGSLPGGQHDGPARAALKLQLLDEESAGEPVALRLWDGDGSVRLLEHDASTRTLLLERLDETRLLTGLPDARGAVFVIAGPLARLTALPAPAGLRRLGDAAHAMLEQVPWAHTALLRGVRWRPLLPFRPVRRDFRRHSPRPPRGNNLPK